MVNCESYGDIKQTASGSADEGQFRHRCPAAGLLSHLFDCFPQPRALEVVGDCVRRGAPEDAFEKVLLMESLTRGPSIYVGLETHMAP